MSETLITTYPAAGFDIAEEARETPRVYVLNHTQAIREEPCQRATAIISIVDSGMKADFGSDIYVDSSGEAKLLPGWDYVLRLTFDDVAVRDPYSESDPVRASDRFIWRDVFGPALANRVLDFLEKLPAGTHVAVHCWAGHSRSMGIAAFMADALGYELVILSTGMRGWANPTVYSTLVREWIKRDPANVDYAYQASYSDWPGLLRGPQQREIPYGYNPHGEKVLPLQGPANLYGGSESEISSGSEKVIDVRAVSTRKPGLFSAWKASAAASWRRQLVRHWYGTRLRRTIWLKPYLRAKLRYRKLQDRLSPRLDPWKAEVAWILEGFKATGGELRITLEDYWVVTRETWKALKLVWTPEKPE